MVQVVRKWFCVIVIVLTVFVLYNSSLKLNFLYDDDYLAIKAAEKTSSQLLLGNCWGERGDGGFYRPLSTLLYKLDLKVWGISPFGYHLTNVCLHALCSVLVFFVGLLLIPDLAFALFAGLMFAVFPMNAEVVNFIGGRVDSIMAVLYLASFYFALNYLKNGNLKLLILSCFLFIFSLFSKETAITFPIMMFAYLSMNGMLQKKWKILLSYLTIAFLYLIVRTIALGTSVGGYGLSLNESLVNVLFGPIRTIQILILPFYQDNLLLYFILMLLIVPASVVGIFLYIKRTKPGKEFYFFIAWVVIAILPTINLLPIGFSLSTTRYWYLPAVGIAWMLSYMAFYGGNSFSKNKRTLILLGGLVFIIYNTYFLFKANKDWTIASDMTRSITKEMMLVIDRQKDGAKIFFWNVPDNYKGCLAGMPIFIEPFYNGNVNVNIYPPTYQYATEVEKEARSAVNFVYVPKIQVFVKKDFKFIKNNNIPRLYEEYTSRSRFKDFIKSLRVKGRQGSI